MGLLNLLYSNKIGTLKEDLYKIVQNYDSNLSSFIRYYKNIKIVKEMPLGTAAYYNIENKTIYLDKKTINNIVKFHSYSDKLKQILNPYYLNNLKTVLHEFIHAYRDKLGKARSLYLEELIAEAISASIIYKSPSEVYKLFYVMKNNIFKDFYANTIDLMILELQTGFELCKIARLLNIEDYCKDINSLKKMYRFLLDKKKAYEKGYTDGLRLAYHLVQLPENEKKEKIRKLLYANSIEDIKNILKEFQIL